MRKPTMFDIRHAASQAYVRMPTGPAVFGDDWPGIFMRGDECLGYAHALREVLREHIAIGGNTAHLPQLADLAELIESCRVKGVPATPQSREKARVEATYEKWRSHKV